MWNDRQCRERRIGAREILWSWAIVALILLGFAAWTGIESILSELTVTVQTVQTER
jgi:cell division protein FtsB